MPIRNKSKTSDQKESEIKNIEENQITSKSTDDVKSQEEAKETKSLGENNEVIIASIILNFISISLWN